MKVVLRPLIVALAFLACAGCARGGEAVLSRGVTAGGPRPTVPTVTTAAVQGPPPAAPSRPVCELLSAADVAAALGNPVRPGTGETKFCFWGTQVDKGSSADVTVGIPAPNRGDQACAVQEAALPKEASQESVSGVGSKAVWSWQPVAILVQGRLIACWSDAVVSVEVTGEQDQATLRQKAVALAETVHGRL